MGEAIGAILSEAVAVPIIAVLMLFTRRARSNSLAFLAGWIVGLSVVAAIVLLLAAVGDLEGSDGGESTASAIIKLVIGVLFLALAFRNWSTRPTGNEEPEMPKWMAGDRRVDGAEVVWACVPPLRDQPEEPDADHLGHDDYRGGRSLSPVADRRPRRVRDPGEPDGGGAGS